MAAADFQWTSCARLRKFRVLISTPRAKRSTRPFCSPHPHAPPSAYLSPLRQSPPGPTSLNPHLHPPSQEPAGLPGVPPRCPRVRTPSQGTPSLVLGIPVFHCLNDVQRLETPMFCIFCLVFYFFRKEG